MPPTKRGLTKTDPAFSAIEIETPARQLSGPNCFQALAATFHRCYRCATTAANPHLSEER